jgi:hypothetical protein
MIIGNNDKISVQGSTFNLAAFACAQGNVAAQAVDLSPYQGHTVRVYLDGNLQIRINPREDMFWQLAEMSIPAPQSRQIQQGTVEVEKTESETILRGETDFDAVPGIDGAEIKEVGHYWKNYRRGLIWQAEATGVRWLGDIGPIVGEEYPVTLLRAVIETNMVSEVIPLDLEEIIIQAFENPV